VATLAREQAKRQPRAFSQDKKSILAFRRCGYGLLPREDGHRQRMDRALVVVVVRKYLPCIRQRAHDEIHGECVRLDLHRLHQVERLRAGHPREG